MCQAMQLFVLLVLGVLLANKLDHAAFAIQTGSEVMVIAQGMEILTELWMLPLMGFVFAMFLVGLFNKLTGKSSCCSGAACEVSNTHEKGDKSS